ncbi:hypothetical protein GOBAR_DD31175 [Gossypium barbadense]|nr:hypothetical protein GOBAR_DD31175 [Gossypium barbadense]
MIDEGDVLVFASKKATVDEIESQLSGKGFKVAALHGDKDQASRMEILQKFKSGIYHVLIATDVAARGLDIKSIKSVVNYDIAKDMDMHVHRIGRTGRAGDKDGIAYTLITQKEARFAGELVNSLIAAGQNVSMELMDLAMKRSQAPQRLYVPPSSRHSHDNYDDNDLDDIDYADNNDTSNDADTNGPTSNGNGGEDDEIDPLDAFMQGIEEDLKAKPPPKPKEKAERYKEDEDEDDPVESFLRSKKDVGLTLAADALRAGYDSDEEVYAAAKAVDAGLLEYDSDDNPVVVDKKKIEPIPALDHSSIEYEPFNKDFYEEKASISDGRFRSKRNARKGGGKKGRGRGGGGSGRGVRGVDFGLGIGYNPESSNASSQAVQSRNAAVNSLKTGMMAQMKSNFVAASSNSQSQGFNNSSSIRRPTLSGFVSGGTIGGDINRSQMTTSFNTAPTSGLNTSQNTGQNATQILEIDQEKGEGPLGGTVSFHMLIDDAVYINGKFCLFNIE